MTNQFVGSVKSQLYSRFRPVYPSNVLKTIADYCRQGKHFRFKRAVDVGCGSGQSTYSLLGYFEEVVGLDPSETQITEANLSLAKKDETVKGKLKFQISAAENLSPAVKTGSVNLLTIAQAIHWVNTEKFYKEIYRVLVPGGVAAIYGYGNVKLDKNIASEAVSKFYTDTIGPYWEPNRKHIDDNYHAFELPFADKQRIDSVVMSHTMTLDDFIGYVSSWSAYWTYMKKYPESEVLMDLRKSLAAIYGEKKVGRDQETNVMVTAEWPVFIILGRK